MSTREDGASLRFNDGYHIDRFNDVALFVAFNFRQPPEVCLLGQLIDAGLQPRIGPRKDDTFSDLGRQTVGDRIKELIKHRWQRSAHIIVVECSVWL